MCQLNVIFVSTKTKYLMPEENQHDLGTPYYRRITAYPHPRYYKMFITTVAETGRGKTGIACEIITNHFKSLPEKEQERLIANYAQSVEKLNKNKNSY